MHILKIVLACLMLVSCSPQGTKLNEAAGPALGNKGTGPDASPPEGARIWGAWTVASVTGTPLVTTNSSGTRSFPLRLTFTPRGFGGNVGCNDFAGQGHLRAGRYHTSMIWSTAVGCGALSDQEDAVAGIMGNYGPRLSLSADGQLVATNGAKTMVLTRNTTSEAQRAEISAGGKPINLIGTVWGINEIDGALADASPTRRQTQYLTFEADYWTATLVCGSASGGWRQHGERIEMIGAITQEVKTCTPAAKAHNAKFIALMKGNPSFGGCCSGGNYEVAESLIAASDDHMMTLSRGASLVDEAALLLGNWSIVTIDGAKPLQIRDNIPKLSFSNNAYSGSTGCNTIGGHFLAHNRFFFAIAGPQTEMGCSGGIGAQESRINALLASRPAITRTKSGNLLLIDAKGHIELARDATNIAAPIAPVVKTWIDLPIDVALLSINGESLPQQATDPRLTLAFKGAVWKASLGCGTREGGWRMRDGIFNGFAQGTPYGTPPCPPADAAMNEALDRMLDGQSRLLITDGKFLLARHDHWITGWNVP